MDDSNSYDPQNAGWARFQFRVPHSPLLKRLKPAQRWRVMELLSLAMDWGNVGVISQYDDEIASTLGMTMGHWSALCDRLLLHCILRVVEVAEGRRVYEFNPQLLCRQKNDQRRPEAFRPETWLLMPDAPPPMQGEEGDSNDGDLLPADMEPEERRQALSKARVAFFRARARARKQSQPEPRRDEFMHQYFIARYGSGGEGGNAATGNAGGENPVTPDGNGNAPLTTTEEKTVERETTDNEGGNGNAASSLPSVTETGVTGEVSVVVVEFLTSLGLWEQQAKEASKWLSLEEAQMYADWVKSDGLPDQVPYLTALASRLRRQHKVPAAFRKQWRKERARKEAVRREAAPKPPEPTQEEAERAELFVLLSDLSSEEQAVVTRQAEERLTGPLAAQMERNRADGKPHGPAVQTALNGHLLALLRERETQDAQAATEGLPHLDAFFEGGQPT